MGATSSSSPKTKISSEQRAAGRQKITQTAKQNIGAAKEQIRSTAANQILSGGQTQMLAVSEVAERQVNRGGDSFTKDEARS